MDLALIPNNADVITSGAQYIDRRLLPGFLASCAAFRGEAGRPVFVREGYRSDAEQLRIFLERYYRTPRGPGVWFDGSYWLKRTGFATAAVPGSDAAKHRLGLAVDLWSGIDTSFSSREHLIWVRVARPHGWVNTGTAFGEPWHQQGTPGVSPAGATPTPFPESEEDDMYTDADRALAVEDRKALDQIKTDVAFIREAVGEGGSDSILTRLENTLGTVAMDSHAVVEAVVYDDGALNAKRGHRSIQAMVREVFAFNFTGGDSMPGKQPATKILDRLLKKTGA
jgi:hypothetical protein